MEAKTYSGLFYNQGVFSTVKDILAREEALSIAINEVPFTITMRTPGHENELVRGLLFSEGVYTDENLHPEFNITASNEEGYVTAMNVNFPEEKLIRDFAGTRNIMSVSSCGICGKTALEENSGKMVQLEGKKLSPEKVAGMFDQMKEHQLAFIQSGGTHAAAAFTLSGLLLDVKEDIGRHNAVDKVIGSLLLNGKLQKAQCLIVSGRISYEIVTKAKVAGMPVLASVSAPSSLAVEHAAACGMSILAFCRNNKLTIYTHPEQIEQVQIA